ncbi:MAG: DUF4365 domain-containing protein [Buchananella hordeovulneris]|nr:DUF4365 domain-containing protein [Buchananella hordeovulneris]
MRKNQATSLGEAGESYIKAQFEELGWIATPIKYQDTGTDLYLCPRDADGNEMPVLIGAQIKSGPSFFKYPKKDKRRNTIGWTFYSDRKHADRWLDHPLPHIIVLYDHKTRIAYWNLITRESVRKTKKGYAIFVPKDKLITQELAEQLAENATELIIRKNSWAFTAWTGSNNIAADAKLRYALIAPRLIAPHPNLYITEIDGLQTLSTILLDRNHLRRIANSETLHTPFSCTDTQVEDLKLVVKDADDEWAWQAAHALFESTYKSASKPLINLYSDTLPSNRRAVAAVITAAFHIDNLDTTRAIKLIDRALAHKDYHPVDSAWLKVQRARLLLEQGNDEDAKNTASEVLAIGVKYKSDLTAAAIASAAIEIIFDITWGEVKLLDTLITLKDNPADWWRRHLIAGGLDDHLELSFKDHCSRGSNISGARTDPHNTFLSASALANYAGNHRAWRWAQITHARSLASLPAKTFEFNQTELAIRLFRKAGQESDLSSLLEILKLRAPVTEYCHTANEVDLQHSTRTSIEADLSTLARLNDFLSDEKVEEIFDWAMGILNPEHRANNSWAYNARICDKTLDLLTTLIGRLNNVQLGTIADLTMRSLESSSIAPSTSLHNLMLRLPNDRWTNSLLNTAHLIRKVLDSQSAKIVDKILISARHASWQSIIHEYLELDIPLIELVHNFADFPNAFIPNLATQLQSGIESASEGINGYIYSGTDNPVVHLAQIASLDADQSLWSTVISMLERMHNYPFDQRRALGLCLRYIDSIEQHNREHLLRVARSIDGSNDPISSFVRLEPIRRLTIPLIARLIDEEEFSRLVTDLLGGGPSGKSLASFALASRPTFQEYRTLLALASDSDATISSNAIFALSQIAAPADADHGLRKMFSRILVEGSLFQADALISGLKKNPNVREFRDLVETALEHPSWLIRSTAKAAASLYES